LVGRENSGGADELGDLRITPQAEGEGEVVFSPVMEDEAWGGEEVRH
jgi:hypothetical protein